MMSPHTFSVRASELTDLAKTGKEFVKTVFRYRFESYDVHGPVSHDHGGRTVWIKQHGKGEGLSAALVPERVMVCMSSARGAAGVIRAGAELAGRLGAPWYAVYVETPREQPGRIRPEDYAALEQNIALAEELGAAIVRVKAARPADGLIAFANREGITHVVIGQTGRARWELLVNGSTLNRFLEDVQDAAVQIVPLET